MDFYARDFVLENIEVHFLFSHLTEIILIMQAVTFPPKVSNAFDSVPFQAMYGSER